MKVVLENKKSKLFFATGGRWVGEIEEAICFANSVDAEEVCKKEKLQNVVVLIKTASGNDVRIRCD